LKNLIPEQHPLARNAISVKNLAVFEESGSIVFMI